MRVCKKCHEEKPLNEFHKNKKCKDGHTYACKVCQHQRQKDLLKQRGGRQEYLNSRLRKLKADVVHFLGGRCAHCGVVDSPVIYDLHHVDPTRKENTWSVRSSWRRVLKEVDKGLLLLCANCHRKEHWKKDHVQDLQKEAETKRTGRRPRGKAVPQA